MLQVETKKCWCCCLSKSPICFKKAIVFGYGALRVYEVNKNISGMNIDVFKEVVFTFKKSI